MKRLFFLLIPAIIFASCGGGSKPANKAEELAKLKKERSEIDLKIKALEAGKKDSAKVVPVSVLELKPTHFNAFVEVHSQVTGDENVLASPQVPGTVKTVQVQSGRKVSKGQVLATLDAAVVEQQIEALSPQLALTKSVYEKQQTLWGQNIGTEVQLMSAKAQYEGVQKQISAMKAQRDMYRVVSPINGTVDAVNLKVGEAASPGMTGIRVVSYDKLKAEASLGENYLGKVKQGDPVTLIMQDVNDTIKTSLSYVAQAVDPASRAFMVQVRLGNNSRIHPNMSCIMKIANYENRSALVVPVSVIQNTSKGTMLYVADGNKAKAVLVTTGRNANGQVEILSGLSAGDKVITAGYESMEEGQQINIQ
ncbi:MAG: efflux transporter periplasmic adaptor subunit [Flavipsychrobacter sp.]|nr:efflux transporter periplasmic adaptor subunit [Flavipsychrobacter sp.]